MVYFVISFLVVYLLYFVFIINKYDKSGNLKVKRKGKIKKFLVSSSDKLPSEVEVFVLKYHVDLKRVNKRFLISKVGLVCSLDIALIIGILSYVPFDNIYVLLGIGFILVVPIILFSFYLLSLYFRKKGLVK